MHKKSTIDWLTVTHKRDNEDACTQFAKAITELMSLREYEQVKEHNWKGYKCLTVDGVTYGERYDSVLGVFKGAWANRGFKVCQGHKVHVTRMDLAVTCHLEQSDPGLAVEAFNRVVELRNDGVWVPTCRIIQNAIGGDTVYLGARSSAQLGRLYDRSGVDTRFGLGDCWRYEVELKKPISGRAYAKLVHSEDIAGDIEGYVHEWFQQRGVEPVYEPGDGNIIMERDTSITSNERKMKWLSLSVAPTVKHLARAGYRQELLALFDLEDAFG